MNDIPSFKKAKSKGTVVEKDGYHQCRQCYCSLTTRKGAYRDVTVQVDGMTIHFYHQNPVVVEYEDGTYRLSSCGYQTKTTKERINRYLPRGYYVKQEDFTWYLEKPNDDRVEFKDGMEIQPQE